MEDKIILYKLEECPYCRKVENKLSNLGVEYVTVEVPQSKRNRRNSEYYDGNFPTVYEISGQTSVPVIIDEKNDVYGMNESDEIVRYLEETYKSNENPIIKKVINIFK